MKWYIPSWNGDLRLEADGEVTKLSIIKPTAAEVEALNKMKTTFIDKSWIKAEDWVEPSRWRKREVTIAAPIAEVGPVASKIMRPGKAVLTAITMADGYVITHDGLQEEPLEETAAAAASEGAEAATTVKRPTPCCPNCLPGAIEPANEVLQAFLSPEQHETWASGRYLYVDGGLTGVRYLIAHRNSPLAAKFGKICYDTDAERVVHFHDRSVPPEEEVLAAMLILRHREPWLRNEATMFGMSFSGLGSYPVDTVGTGPGAAPVFQNPFGDITDGVADAVFTAGFGTAAAAAR